ncbi:hypothetical protein [Alicyclobacillus sp. ALC3]|uniref:hypothetical protein n=1 Tax=Alicyclobacillus sp. ALC3 TaxID=2796143 RepID=UPI0023793855|nr:hypothetical protein [Alicyclobacillus sp. ALC3]WDL99729.1 hypothetical protein JC200_24165 [Alicyclobacillus sp. ALC3]
MVYVTSTRNYPAARRTMRYLAKHGIPVAIRPKQGGGGYDIFTSPAFRHRVRNLRSA